MHGFNKRMLSFSVNGMQGGKRGGGGGEVSITSHFFFLKSRIALLYYVTSRITRYTRLSIHESQLELNAKPLKNREYGIAER